MKARGKIKDKKSAILNAALTQITRYGLHGVSMKMIAEEADVAAGTIYIHFKNKEEMLSSLYLNITDDINLMVEEFYLADASFKENFIRIWSEILKEYIKDQRIPDFISLFAFSAGDNSANSKQLLAPIYELFINAQTVGIVKDMPVPGLIALAHGPITALVRMARSKTFQINSIDVGKYAEACWDAIKA